MAGLRIGVGDGGSDKTDWAMFYPRSGNGGTDFSVNGRLDIGGEDKLADEFSSSTTIKIIGMGLTRCSTKGSKYMRLNQAKSTLISNNPKYADH